MTIQHTHKVYLRVTVAGFPSKRLRVIGVLARLLRIPLYVTTEVRQ